MSRHDWQFPDYSYKVSSYQINYNLLVQAELARSERQHQLARSERQRNKFWRNSQSPPRTYRRINPSTYSTRVIKNQATPVRDKKYDYSGQKQLKYSPRSNKYKYLDDYDRLCQQTKYLLRLQQISPTPVKQKPKQPQTTEKVWQDPLQRSPTPVIEEPIPPKTPEKIPPPDPPKEKNNNNQARLKERCDKLQQLNKRNLQEIKNLTQEIQELQQEKDDMIPRSAKFFEGDVLVNFEDYKERLTQLIQQKFNTPIKRTKLLFRLEKDHPRNLHPFVDNQSPFVLIVKNKKEDREYHFACISQGAISPNLKEQKRGWLISLTNGRVYPVANGKSAVLHDELYLIFGNQEVRIDGSSDKVFSNFGISNSFYNTSGNDVRDFLGPGLQGTPREAAVDSYQIFKVIF